MADGPIIDQWSGLDHLVGMGEDAGELDYAPPYLDDQQKRRINAYLRLRAYLETVRREFLAEDPDDAALKDKWREFGDPATLVDRVAAAVLGDDPFVAVLGIDDPVPDAPDIPPAPKEPAGDLPDVERDIRQSVYDAAIETWRANAEATIEMWQADLARIPLLEQRHDWLQDWAVDDDYLAKLVEMESENTVALGSGVIVHRWDRKLGRVVTETYDPDAYFPVLDDSIQSQYPNRVHLAWIFTEVDESGNEVEYVRRITYELVPLDPADPDYEALDFGAPPRYLTEGQIQTQACLYSNGVWLLADFERLADIQQGATWEVVETADGQLVDADRVPLNIDFIPVVHVPNTLNSSGHFGRPLLVRLCQLLDEIAGTDTDEALASRWAAQPPVALSGLEPGATTIDMTPGQGVKLGEGGRISTINMAENLSQIGDRQDRNLKRLSVNGQVPEGLLGRVDASEVPSGLALTLSFTSFEQLIKKMRMARGRKFPLSLKFVQRLAIQNDDPTLEGSTEVHSAELRFGTFMPQDLLTIAQIIAMLYQADMISQETGLAMAQEGGVPSTDLGDELASIRATQAEKADLIAEALGDSRWAAEFLGVTDYEAPGGVDTEGGAVIPPPGANVPASGATEQ